MEEGFQTVGERLIRAEDPEIALLSVQLRHIAQEAAEHMYVADSAHPGHGHFRRVVAEIRHPQIPQKDAAIGVRVRSHASFALGRQLSQFRFQATLRIEKLLRPVALQPVFKEFEVLGMGRRIGERHLMRTECAFDLQAIDHLRSRPALGRLEDDHRPARPSRVVLLRALRWIWRMLSMARSKVPAMS